MIIIGDPGVGKSNILTRFIKNEFDDNSCSTMGVDFYSKTFIRGEDKIKLQIWDTAGQDNFRAIVKSYYKGIHAAIIAFDITNKKSFNSLPKWFSDINTHSDREGVPILVAGNKSDLKEERTVILEDIKKFVDDAGLVYCETSAKYNGDKMIEEMFDILLEKVLDYKQAAFEKKVRINKLGKTSLLSEEVTQFNLENGEEEESEDGDED